MKARGISLVTSKMSDQTLARKTKAGDSSFDSIMTDHTAKAANTQPKDGKAADKTVDTGETDGADNSVPLKQKTPRAERDAGTKDPKAPDNLPQKGIDTEVTESQMVFSLQEVYGMDIDALHTFMKQSGMSMNEVLGSIQNGDLTASLQKFVMDFHGITDKAAFLTNDTLVQELNELRDHFNRIFEGLQLTDENLAGMDEADLAALAEQIDDLLAQSAGEGTEDTVSDQMGLMMETPETGPEVTVEESRNGNSDAQTGTFMNRRDAEPVVHHHDTVTANLFTERLAEAFEASAGEEVSSARDVMTHIVDQVVNQVKIRVMPETTSMEIMLHPESLGRVNIHVSATAGVAKATLLVENLMAKEALESQMITLKQTFEEQGLKVDAVEVTVSEFGLNQENRQAREEQRNGSRNRRFRMDAGDDSSINEDAVEVQAERRDRNSMVDYTV